MSKVLVMDANNNELAPTNNANARRLLKKKEATIFNKNPFTIKLKKEIKEMKSLTPREVRELLRTNEDIHVQNISDPIAIIALSFKNKHGERIPFKGIPANRDPICLSDYVSNENIREGSNIQGFLNPSQTNGKPRLAVITKEEYDNYYKKKVKERKAIFNTNTSAEELKEEAKREVSNVGKLKEDQSREVKKEVEEAPKEAKKKLPTDPINPRVRGICEELNPENVEKPDMPKIIDTLKNLNLDSENLMFLKKGCHENALILKWAEAQL